METMFLVLSFGFLILINTASPSTPSQGEPVIYVTFSRWENRTFSPRIYYLMLQKYGLTNKLLDLNNEYHKYLTDSEITPQNPPVNIIFKSKPRKPNSEVTDFADRSALGTINRKKGFLNLRAKDDFNGGGGPLIIGDLEEKIPPPSSVVFPPVLQPDMPPLAVSNFFADRIAYPGSSTRRTAPIGLGDRKEIGPNQGGSPLQAQRQGQLVSPGVFDSPSQLQSASSKIFTNDDVVDTVSLLLDIFKHSSWDDQNVVLSPFSLTNIMALLFMGSNGTTFNELGKELKPKHPLTVDDKSGRELRFHAAFRRLLNFLHRGSTQNVAINICNRILVDNKYPLLESYKKDAVQYYDAQSDSFDFTKQAEEVMKIVNTWVSYKTNGKITSIIDSPPSSETTLMLLNAVYFRGDWEVPFIKEITQRKPFYVTPWETIDVSMMTNILNVPYIETTHYRAVGIPYKGKGIGLFVLLPTNPGVKGLKEMEKEMTLEKLMKFSSMKLSQVTIQIPKMRMESEGHIKHLLQNFGIDSMFNPKTANFSRMSDTVGLHVSSVLHKSIFEMNEDGVSAAAVTVATGDRTLDDRQILFTVNRPFSFIIMNIKAKTVLFFGRVTRPLPLDDN